MIVYEVNLEVQRSVYDEFRGWLAEHIRAIIALPGFAGAELFECTEAAVADAHCRLCVQYRLVDHAALERYLRDDAPRLRADGERRFGGKFSGRRRVLRSLPFD
jgi:hypothetical protein